MDNKVIDITYEGSKELAMAISLAWKGMNATHYKIAEFAKRTQYFVCDGRVTSHYTTLLESVDMSATAGSISKESHVTPENGVTFHYFPCPPTLILAWADNRPPYELFPYTPLPYSLDKDLAITFVEGWLRSVDYGRQPDIDGECGKGWRVFTDDWGHVGNHTTAIFGVQPIWAMSGK